MSRGKGWHGEPRRHALASKGIATKFHKKGSEEGMKELINSFLLTNENVKDTSTHQQDNEIIAQFFIYKKRMYYPQSALTYDIVRNKLTATLRFPTLSRTRADEFDDQIKNVNSAERLVYTRYNTGYHEQCAEVVPHVEIELKNVSNNEVVDELQRIESIIEKGVSVYE